MERHERYWWHPMEGASLAVGIWQTEKRAFWDFFREKRIARVSKKKYRVTYPYLFERVGRYERYWWHPMGVGEVREILVVSRETQKMAFRYF